MSPHRTAPRALLGLALAATVAVSGCGSGSKSSSDTTVTTATTVEPATTTTAAVTTTTTAAATTTTTAPSAAVTTSQALGVVTGFAQALGTKDYSAAYQAWADGGAASGSSEADLAAGYAATDQYDLHVTGVGATGAGVDVAVVVLAVAQDGGSQVLQMYQGSYLVAPTASGARITTGQLQVVDALPTDLADALGSPQGLIDGYYAYIDAGNHGAAFTLWAGTGTSSGVTPAAFVDGYAATKSDTVTMGQFDESPGAGSLYAKVPTVVQATTTSGTDQLFCGTYTLRKSNMPPFDGLGWAIESGDLEPVAATGADPGTVLANGCTG